MLGIEDYGSGSDNDSDRESITQPSETSKSNDYHASTSKPSHPLPKSKRAPKKFTIGLPSLPNPKANEELTNDDRPNAKRPRLEAGAGKSSLLSMLPTPKEKAPIAPAPQRVLGGGKASSLAFRTTLPDTYLGDDGESAVEEPASQNPPGEPQEQCRPPPTESLPFVPSSLKRGRANVSLEEDGSSKSQSTVPNTFARAPAMDFFSLGHTLLQPSLPSSTTLDSGSTPSTGVISSAPDIPTFQPPEPSQADEYPGYYQTPSGAWAAYNPEYYARFLKKWQDEYDAHVRALEKGTAKGFEGLENAHLEDANALEEMERAKKEIQLREERKAITQGAGGEPAQPKMKISASKMSGIARSRHQLATLLKEAYENREALEEKIAQGKRNRKEAGNKYGF